MTATPLELIPEGVADADVATFRAFLLSHGWQTRRQLCEALGWTERTIREVAEACGADVVRGQLGFKLTDQLTREDLTVALKASDAAMAQGRKQFRYGVALRRRIHRLIA